jgi:hypothetical protein
MSEHNTKPKLTSNFRILLGLTAIPSLFLAYMVMGTILNGDYKEIEYFEWFYSVIGFVAIYMSVTGKRLF